MISLLMLTLSVPAPAIVPDTNRPPVAIRLRLSDEDVRQGDRVKVRVKTAADGYLLVLRADAAGRVRVLFPIEPDDSNRVPGGKEYEIRGRGDREAFTVDDREGTGLVLAAWSAEPFKFDAFIRGRHWDYRALAGEHNDDAEAQLLDLADSMATGHYDYDLVNYTVSPLGQARSYAGYYGGYRPWYRPFFSPLYPFYGPRFGFDIVIGRPFYRRPFYRRPFFWGWW